MRSVSKFLLFIVFLIACERDADEVNATSPDLSKIANEMSAEYLTGALKSYITDNHEYLLFLNTAHNTDYQKAFIVQMSEVVDAVLLDRHFDLAVFSSGVLLRDKQHGATYYLGADNEESQTHIQELMKRLGNRIDKIILGYGFAYYAKGTWHPDHVAVIKKTSAFDIILNGLPASRVAWNGCSSGGTGSSSCSSAVCSVSCNGSSHYACCNTSPPACQCIPYGDVGTWMARGKVVSKDDGLPIPGASVLIKGTTVGTVTDADGTFGIAVMPTQTLIFSFIGHQSQEISVGTQGYDLYVTLNPDIQ